MKLLWLLIPLGVGWVIGDTMDAITRHAEQHEQDVCDQRQAVAVKGAHGWLCISVQVLK